MNKPVVSVIIPTYNRKKVIGRAIESVLNQKFSDFEILVIDDGSKDGTARYIQDHYFDSRIKIIRLEENKGVHHARNVGIDRSFGEFILFLDSDDELLPEALHYFVKKFFILPKVGLITAPYITNRGELTGYDLKKDSFIPFSDMLCQIHSRRLKPGIPMIRREILGDIRFVAENCDFIFYRYIGRIAPMYYIARPLGIYHLIEENTSLHIKRKYLNLRLSIERAKVIDRFLCDFKEDYLMYCPKLLGLYAYSSALGLTLANEIFRARVRAREAFFYNFSLKNFILLFCVYLPGGPTLLSLSLKFAEKLQKLKSFLID